VEAFDACIDPAIGRYSLMGYDESNLWTVDHLCDHVLQEGFLRIPPPITELLIYFTGIRGRGHTYPAFRALQACVDDNPKVALVLLSRHIRARNIRVQAQVWRLLAQLRNAHEIPKSIDREAQKRLIEIQRIRESDADQGKHVDVLERDINWFLEGRELGEGQDEESDPDASSTGVQVEK
jgi:hypothetical protein